MQKKSAVKHGVYDASSGTPPPQDIDGGSVKPAPKAAKPKAAKPKAPKFERPTAALHGNLDYVDAYMQEMGEGRATPGFKQPLPESRDATGGMKKGGVASASKRADGIAQRGKTRGRMV